MATSTASEATPAPSRGRAALLGAGLATAVSAALFGAAFPPWELHALAWIALLPFLVALRSVGSRAALGLSLLFALCASLATGTWFVGSAAGYFEQSVLVGVGLFLFTVATMAGPYYMAFGACYVRLPRRFDASLPLLAASAWVAIDLGRGRLLTGSALLVGNPSGLIGYSQVGLDPVVQIASVTGIYGVSFAIVPVNAALAELWLALRDRGAERRIPGAALLLGATPAVLVVFFGIGTLASVGEEPGEPLRAPSSSRALPGRSPARTGPSTTTASSCSTRRERSVDATTRCIAFPSASTSPSASTCCAVASAAPASSSGERRRRGCRPGPARRAS